MAGTLVPPSANIRQVGGDHYKTGGLEHWDLVEKYGVGYLEGCASKYIARWRKKDGLQGLKKADHYLEKLIELSRKEPGRYARPPRGYVPNEALLEFCRRGGLTEDWELAVLRHLFQWSSEKDLEKARNILILAIQGIRQAQSGTPEDGGQHGDMDE